MHQQMTCFKQFDWLEVELYTCMHKVHVHNKCMYLYLINYAILFVCALTV